MKKEVSEMGDPRENDEGDEDFYEYFKTYLQKIIKEDIGHIYGKEARLLDEEEPFACQAD